MHDVTVLHDIVLAFGGQLTRSAASGFATQCDEIGVFDNFRTNETAFKIRMDNTGTLRCFSSGFEGPSPHLVGTGGKECTEVQQRICRFDKAVDATLLQAYFFEEHLSLFVSLEFGNLAFNLRG